AEAEPLLEPGERVGQVHAVLARQRQQEGRRDRAFEVDVEPPLRHAKEELVERASRRAAAPPFAHAVTPCGGRRSPRRRSTASGTSPRRAPPSRKTPFP